MTNNNLDLHKGDTAPNLVLTLTDNGDPVDLSDAQRIDIILESGLKTITRQVFGGADGIINMPWQAGDTDVPGTYNSLARVTFGDGKIQTWPAQGNFFVTIRE